MGDQRIRSLGSGQPKPVVATALSTVEPAMAARARNLFEPACTLVDTARCAAEQYPRLREEW